MNAQQVWGIWHFGFQILTHWRYFPRCNKMFCIRFESWRGYACSSDDSYADNLKKHTPCFTNLVLFVHVIRGGFPFDVFQWHSNFKCKGAKTFEAPQNTKRTCILIKFPLKISHHNYVVKCYDHFLTSTR